MSEYLQAVLKFMLQKERNKNRKRLFCCIEANGISAQHWAVLSGSLTANISSMGSQAFTGDPQPSNSGFLYRRPSDTVNLRNHLVKEHLVTTEIATIYLW